MYERRESEKEAKGRSCGFEKQIRGWSFIFHTAYARSHFTVTNSLIYQRRNVEETLIFGALRSAEGEAEIAVPIKRSVRKLSAPVQNSPGNSYLFIRTCLSTLARWSMSSSCRPECLGRDTRLAFLASVTEKPPPAPPTRLRRVCGPAFKLELHLSIYCHDLIRLCWVTRSGVAIKAIKIRLGNVDTHPRITTSRDKAWWAKRVTIRANSWFSQKGCGPWTSKQCLRNKSCKNYPIPTLWSSSLF